MRIAYILGHFPVLSETFIGEEIRAMKREGHEIFPIALQNPGGEFQPEDSELVKKTYYFSHIEKYRAKKLIWKYFFRLHKIIPFMLSQTTEPYFPFLAHCADVAEYIKKNKCDHIHAHFGWGATTYAIGAAKLLGLPVTFTCHGSDVYARPIDLKAKCNNADTVVCVAPTIAKDVQKIQPKAKCKVIYCGVDIDKFKPVEDISKKHDRWIFMGRLVDCKGLDDILASWKLLPLEKRPKLDVVGEGVLKEKLIQYVKENDLENHITFLGAKPSSWISENGPYYRALIAAFKQGSDGSRDTSPIVLKEAMAMGLPIVTTGFIDVPLIVGSNSAILCNVSSPESIAGAVIQISNMDNEQLQEMEEAGRKRAVENFSIKKQAEELTALFNSLR